LKEESFNLYEKETFVSKRSLNFFQTNNSYNIIKAKQMLGYRSKVELKEGLARTASWYKKKGLI